jgi:hypothetical protein
MRKPYSFSILRYVHDPVTQEFINVGVAVYSHEARFLRAKCTTRYERITKMFARIDGERFRQLISYIENRVNTISDKLPSSLPFETGLAMGHLLTRVLPQDDSSIQFSDAGVGLGVDLEKTLGELFNRYVERYTQPTEVARREDEDIWRVFREPLARRQVSALLKPKRIYTPNFDYEFKHAWKNQIWHLYEPVSFDLTEGRHIVDKANRWLGRATTLYDSPVKFKIHLLLGAPEDTELKRSFEKAQHILEKIPAKKEFIQEEAAEAFAEEFEREIRQHENKD